MRSIRLAVIALVTLAASCAAHVEGPDTDPVGTPNAQIALSKFSPTLEMRAVRGVDGITTIDLTTGNMFGPNDPHYIPGGSFEKVQVWVTRADSSVVRYLGMVAAGGVPGGGCIHIVVPGLGVGDFLQVRSIVDTTSGKTQPAAVDTLVVPAPQASLPFTGPPGTDNLTLN